MRHTPRKLRDAYFGDLYLSPRERRRLARAGSAPGRRFAVPVPLRRPSGGTREGIALLLLYSCPGLRRRHLVFRRAPPYELHIELPEEHHPAARAALRPALPAGVRAFLFAPGSKRPWPVAWNAPAERAPILLPWETEPTFELTTMTGSSMLRVLIDRKAWPRPSVALLSSTPLDIRVPTVDVEARPYASEILGWRDFVFATRRDHETRILDILRGAEAVIEALAELGAMARKVGP